MRLGSLLLVNNAANLLTAPLFWLLTVVGINYLVANLLTLGLVFLHALPVRRADLGAPPDAGPADLTCELVSEGQRFLGLMRSPDSNAR